MYGTDPAPKVTYVCPTCRTMCDEPERTNLDLWADAWCPRCAKRVEAVAEGQPDTSERDAAQERRRASWPTTVDEAVERLLTELPPEALERIRVLERGALHGLHFGLGLSIRNGFGVWQGNKALLDSCARYGRTKELYALWTGHPDDASAIIVEALWLRLQEDRPA